MKDKTKHTIAREIVFAVKLFLAFAIISIAIVILNADRILSRYLNLEGLIFLVFGTGYGYRLYKWVKRWK